VGPPTALLLHTAMPLPRLRNRPGGVISSPPPGTRTAAVAGGGGPPPPPPPPLRYPACRAAAVGNFPAEAPSWAQYGPRVRAPAVYLIEQRLVPYGRVREVLADLFDAPLALWMHARWVQQGAAQLAPVEARIKAALVRAPVLPIALSDETSVRQAGQLA
jgi:hypothetical protein